MKKIIILFLIIFILLISCNRENSDIKNNLNGRINLPYSIIWGAITYLWIKYGLDIYLKFYKINTKQLVLECSRSYNGKYPRGILNKTFLAGVKFFHGIP